MATLFRSDGWVRSSQGAAVSSAQVYVCLQPADISPLPLEPPTPLADIYADPNGLVPITQPILTDGLGHYNFYTLQGFYTLIVVNANRVQNVYPDQTVGFGSTLVLQTNGIPNVNQALLNLTSQDASITIVNTGGRVDLSAPSTAVHTLEVLPSWLGSGDGSPYQPNSGNGLFNMPIANQVKCWTIRLFQPTKVTRLDLRVNTGVAASVAGFAVYNSTGTVRLISWGSINTGTSLTNRTLTLGATVTLPAGIYIMAVASSSTSNSSTEGGYGTGDGQEATRAWNLGTVRTGTAANPMVAGVMPATLGVITVSNSMGPSVPLIVMQP